MAMSTRLKGFFDKRTVTCEARAPNTYLVEYFRADDHLILDRRIQLQQDFTSAIYADAGKGIDVALKKGVSTDRVGYLILEKHGVSELLEKLK